MRSVCRQTVEYERILEIYIFRKITVEHSAVDPKEDEVFQFHPREMADAALLPLFGCQLDGAMNSSYLEPKNTSAAVRSQKLKGILIVLKSNDCI